MKLNDLLSLLKLLNIWGSYWWRWGYNNYWWWWMYIICWGGGGTAWSWTPCRGCWFGWTGSCCWSWILAISLFLLIVLICIMWAFRYCWSMSGINDERLWVLIFKLVYNICIISSGNHYICVVKMDLYIIAFQSVSWDHRWSTMAFSHYSSVPNRGVVQINVLDGKFPKL